MKKNAKSARSVLTEATVNLASNKKLCSVNEVIGCEHFSDLHKLFRIIAYVKRFIVNLRSRICKNVIALNPILPEGGGYAPSCFSFTILKQLKLSS